MDLVILILTVSMMNGKYVGLLDYLAKNRNVIFTEHKISFFVSILPFRIYVKSTVKMIDVDFRFLSMISTL